MIQYLQPVSHSCKIMESPAKLTFNVIRQVWSNLSWRWAIATVAADIRYTTVRGEEVKTRQAGCCCQQEASTPAGAVIHWRSPNCRYTGAPSEPACLPVSQLPQFIALQRILQYSSYCGVLYICTLHCTACRSTSRPHDPRTRT